MIERRLAERLFLACIGVIALVLFAHAPRPRVDTSVEVPRVSDYQREVAEYDRRLAQVDAAVPEMRQLELRYRRALLTGDTATLAALAATLGASGAADSVLALRVDLSLHRLSGAMARLPKLAANTDGITVELLRAQVLAQTGHYEEAARTFTGIIDKSKHWEALAGLAALEATYGRFERADALYEQAGDDLDARQMRTYSWVQLQRGLLQLRQGRIAAALEYYDQAERAYSGSWMVDDYKAEALAAAGRYEESIARYRSAIAKAPRPELQQALGDLYRSLGQTENAGLWLDRAHAGYGSSVDRGQTHYLHHLARYYSDSRLDAAKAITLARRDLDLRQVPASYDMLAWALYRNGQFVAARDAIERALSSSMRDADIYLHAAMIHLALGNAEQGRHWLEEAASLNPHNTAFHVHR